MAVGLACMLGIEFPKNFNAPYLSKSISIFWKRWHITLSSFIMDYLYIAALGGNRRGKARTYVNLIICFFLCGLWHGAKMTFVVWGIYQGVFLVYERMLNKKTAYSVLPGWGQVAITFVIIMFGWVLFRSPSIGQAMHYWGTMIGLVKASASAPLLSAEVFSARHVFEMALCAVLVWQPVQAYNWVMNKLSAARFALCMIIFVYAIFGMFSETFSPFLYFQF